MKKLSVVIIVVQTIVILALFVYAFAQATIAKKAVEDSLEQREFADLNAVQVRYYADSVTLYKRMAEQQKEIAEDALRQVQLAMEIARKSEAEAEARARKAEAAARKAEAQVRKAEARAK